MKSKVMISCTELHISQRALKDGEKTAAIAVIFYFRCDINLNFASMSS